MKFLLQACSLTCLLFCGYFKAEGQDVAFRVVDFEGAGMETDTLLTANTSNPEVIFEIDELLFPSHSNSGFWIGGWGISTSRNDSVGDFRNLAGSAKGSGAEGSRTYMVGQNKAYILLPEGSEVAGFQYNNLRYTADVLRLGSRFTRVFGVDSMGNSGFPDSLILKVDYYANGLLSGSFSWPLADYRGEEEEDFIVEDWRAAVPLNASGDTIAYLADSLVFSLLSSDNGEFGNNTPDFFALDNLLVRRNIIASRELAQKPLLLTPNMSSTHTRISGLGPVSGRLFILDGNGRTLLHGQRHDSGTEIPLDGLQPGQYLILFEHGAARYAGRMVKF